jgi:hypothetical protein
MPKWAPAKSRGECNPINYIYPVKFDIQNTDPNSVSNIYQDEIDCLLKLDSVALDSVLYNIKSSLWREFSINILNNECKIKNDSAVIYGRIIRFPEKETFREELYLEARYNDSILFTTDLNTSGKFKTYIKKRDTISLKFDFANPKLFSLEDLYYPIVIKNISLSSDSIDLGIIPFIKDDYGRYGEWGRARKNIFQKYDHYYTETIHNMPERLILEKKLTDIYDSTCIKCDPIFITEVRKWKSKKKLIGKRSSSWIENRYFIIDYNELLRLSKRLKNF